MTGASLLEDADFAEIEREVLALIDEAVAEALVAAPPDVRTLEKDVYVKYA